MNFLNHKFQNEATVISSNLIKLQAQNKTTVSRNFTGHKAGKPDGTSPLVAIYTAATKPSQFYSHKQNMKTSRGQMLKGWQCSSKAHKRWCYI